MTTYIARRLIQTVGLLFLLSILLFALVNLSRHVKVDAEGALRRTIDKFTSRFAHVEKRVKEQHDGWGSGGEKNLPLEILDTYWEEAKAAEKAAGKR